MLVSIYTLSDPRTGKIRYVGKAKDAKHRYGQHVSNFETGYKANWIRGLKAAGLRPVLDIVEQVHESEWEQSERFWIAYFRFLGFSLMNIDLGGNGAHKVSDSMREKCRLIHLGKKRSVEARERMRQAHLGKMLSQEQKIKIGLSNIGKKKGIPVGDSVKGKISKALTGRKQSPESIAKRVSKNTGKKRSPEIREKMALICQMMRDRKAAKTP